MDTVGVHLSDVGVKSHELRMWLLTRTAMALAAVMECQKGGCF